MTEERIQGIEQRIHEVEERQGDLRSKMNVLDTTVSLSLSQINEKLGDIRADIRAERVVQAAGNKQVQADIQVLKERPGTWALGSWKVVTMLVATSLVSGVFGGCAVAIRQVVEKAPALQQTR